MAARIKRADRRPQGWGLNLALVRADLARAEVAALERQFPGLAARLGAGRAADEDQSGGVQSPHPVPGTGEAVDNPASEVRQLHPATDTGCNERGGGVQPARPRGAAVAPEPSFEPSVEPSAAAGRAPVRDGAAADGVGGGPVDDFFAALGGAWRLSAGQRSRLAAMVERALRAGWTPAALAEFTGANTEGVRSPYAVLAARLSRAELPPPGFRQPPWCGDCDQATRMLDYYGDAPHPCPRCKTFRSADGIGGPVRRPQGAGGDDPLAGHVVRYLT